MTGTKSRVQIVREEIEASGLGRLTVMGVNDPTKHVTVSWTDGPTGLEVREVIRSVPAELVRTHRKADGPLMAALVRIHRPGGDEEYPQLPEAWYRDLLEEHPSGEETQRDRLVAEIVAQGIIHRPSRARPGEVSQRLVAWRTLTAVRLLQHDDDATLEVLGRLMADAVPGEVALEGHLEAAQALLARV